MTFLDCGVGNDRKIDCKRRDTQDEKDELVPQIMDTAAYHRIRSSVCLAQSEEFFDLGERCFSMNQCVVLPPNVS